MKYLVVVGALLIGAFVIFNSNKFQAYFLTEQFYKKIYEGPFDVTKKGESTVIPIKYKYKTNYALAISLPDRFALDSLQREKGEVRYQFISKNQILKKGITIPPIWENSSYSNDTSFVDILMFDLPFPGAGDDLTLELEVVTPMTFLEAYSGSITCFINPHYDPK